VALKLSRTTYFEWKKAYQERGLDGLKVRPLPGAAPKLTDRQTSQLCGWLVGRDPRQFQFDFALWTRKIVRELIRLQFGVEMTPQGVGKLALLLFPWVGSGALRRVRGRSSQVKGAWRRRCREGAARPP